jgi:hypothetical protein
LARPTDRVDVPGCEFVESVFAAVVELDFGAEEEVAYGA